MAVVTADAVLERFQSWCRRAEDHRHLTLFGTKDGEIAG